MPFLLLLLVSMAFGHQSSLTGGGAKLKWTYTNLPIAIQTNTTDLPSATTRNLILSSMAQWNGLTSKQLTESGTSANAIIFKSDFSQYGSSVIGVTELSYNSSGIIQQGTIYLNDNYLFMGSPGFYGGNTVHLGDVVTHELGHFLGLGHSEVLDSTMFYSAFPGQSTVALDDVSALREKYSSGFGKISGYVQGGNFIGVLGAHVQAISRSSGKIASAISDENGFFEIGGLDLGDTYYLYTSPVKNLHSLPGIYANVQTRFCPGSYVGSFFTKCGSENQGSPQGINLIAATPAAYVGTISIGCTLKTDPEYALRKVQNNFSSPVTVFNHAQDPKSEKAFVGYFRNPANALWSDFDELELDLSHYADFSGDPKVLKIQLVSQQFGSRMQYELIVKQHGSGTELAHKTYDTTPVGTLGLDLEAYVALDPSTSSNNIFEISVRAKKLSNTEIAYSFPSPEVFSSEQNLPYLLISSVFSSTGSAFVPVMDTGSTLSDNRSCLEGPFTYAVAKAQSSESNDTSSQTPKAAGCGTIDTDGPHDGPGNSGTLFLGFALISFLSALAKRSKKFLS